MPPFAAASRRALVATGLLAAPVGAAAKTKPPPPLTIAGAAIVGLAGAGDGTVSIWSFEAHASDGAGLTSVISGTTAEDVDAPAEQVRAAIAASLRDTTAAFLTGEGRDVPLDRVAIALQ